MSSALENVPAGESPVPDIEHVGGAPFWVGLVVGWGVIIGGVLLALHDAEVKPWLLVSWVVGGLVLHDAIWLPVLAVFGVVAGRVARRRLSPVLVWAFATSAVLALIAWPFVRGYGRRRDVPSALSRNYALGLLGYLVFVWLVAGGAMIAAARRRRRSTLTTEHAAPELEDSQ